MSGGEARISPGTSRVGVVECAALLLIGGMRRPPITPVRDGEIEVPLKGFGLPLRKG